MAFYTLGQTPVDGRDGADLWKGRGRMKYPPRLLHGVDVSVLRKGEGPSTELPELFLMASRAHNVTFEGVEMSRHD